MLYRINALCATLMFFAGFTLCASAVELPADSASPYHNEWRQIREALNNRLPKTALDPVGRLYARAVKDKNHANIATAAFLRAFLTSQGSPAPDSAAISLIERELRAAPTPPARATIFIFYNLLSWLMAYHSKPTKWTRPKPNESAAFMLCAMN